MDKFSRSFDILGNIIILKFPFQIKQKEKKKAALEILKNNPSVKTILEKVGKFKGRLRKQTTKWLAGEKTKEALYRENGCTFRFNVDKTYFSPRLSNERKEIADKIHKGNKVLVMFAGVAPFSIVIAKNSRAGEIFSNEINREANKYAKLNIDLNKIKDRIKLLSGDIKKVAKELTSKKEKFDVIVMPRPQLKDSFLKEAFMLSKKGTRIFYYDFCRVGNENQIIQKIKDEARLLHKKIKILKIKKAGEVGPYRLRIRIDLRVL